MSHTTPTPKDVKTVLVSLIKDIQESSGDWESWDYDGHEEEISGINKGDLIENDIDTAVEKILKMLLLARQEGEKAVKERFIRQLRERKMLISKDGMAEEYIQELINDYTDELALKDSHHE